MAANSDPIFSLTPHIAGQEFTSADTTTLKTLVTGATNGTRIDVITCSTSDTVAVDLGIYVQVGGSGTNFFLGNVHLPPGAGYSTTPGVDAIAALPLTNFRAIVLNAADVLKAACAATMTSGKTTDVVALGGDF